MAKCIAWSDKAQLQLNDILVYWDEVTSSPRYSSKLIDIFDEEVTLLAQYPFIGTATDTPNVRKQVVKDYLLFYEVSETHLTVLTIWDGRRNPEERPVKQIAR